MVGGDRITEHRQDACALNIDQRFRLGLHIIKERRQANIGRIALPAVGVRTFHFDRFPLRRAFKDLGILFAEHLSGDLFHGACYFSCRRPDIFQINRIALAVVTDWIACQVNVHITRQRIGHNQRRRGQPVGFDQRMNTAFEVTVARKHRADGKIALLDRLLDRIR
ncbi:hypothetical protein D3C72_1021110 [compost metagenome]